MPTPRSSMSPESVSAGRTRSRPPARSRWTRSSPTSLANRNAPLRRASINSSARRDLPASEGPRINSAPAPTRTAEAWTVASVIRRPSPSRRRQANDKTRAEDGRLPVRAGSSGAVLDPDRPAMGFDDLLGNRQAETGILTESLVRAIGIEPLENLFAHFRPHTRTVVIDKNLDEVAQAPAVDANRAACRRERARVLDQIVDDLTEPGVVAGNLEAVRAAAFEPQRNLDAILALDLVGDGDQRGQELGAIDGRRFLALQFGIKSTGIGNIGDQTVEPPHVVLNDGKQPRAAFVTLGQR